MKIRVIVVDDERLARQRLRRMLSAEPDVEIVAECDNGSTAIAQTQEEKPDLLCSTFRCRAWMALK
jgi:chemotaxis response regulator CheB